MESSFFSPLAIEIASHGIWLAVFVSAIPLLACAVAGLCCGLFQAVTQIQEQVVSFAVKLAVCGALLFFGSSWLLAELTQYFHLVLESARDGGAL